MDDFGDAAACVANGGGWLLSSFELIVAESLAVVDVDLSRHGAAAWVVGHDRAGQWWAARVGLQRSAGGAWRHGSIAGMQWDGWPELAMNRPARQWPEWGPVLGLTIARGGPCGGSFTSVLGVAARDVAAVVVQSGQVVRARSIDTPTGGFIVSVPTAQRSPAVRVVYCNGETIRLK